MKKTLKKISWYLIFLVVSFLFVYFGSTWISNSLSQKFESQIRTVMMNRSALRKICSDQATYDSLKNAKQIKVELLSGDQGSEKTIYFPTKINGHCYQVSFQSKTSSWNRYYGTVRLTQIKK